MKDFSDVQVPIVSGETYQFVPHDTYNLIRGNIFIEGLILDEIGTDVLKQILFLNRTEKEFINIFIDSPGGSFDATVLIITAMNQSPKKIRTINYNKACSGGAMIAYNGTPGYRLSYPYSRWMIHDGAITGNDGAKKVNKVKLDYDDLRKTNEFVIKNLVKITGKPAKFFKEFLPKDKHMSASEALKLNLFDRYVTKKDTLEF